MEILFADSAHPSRGHPPSVTGDVVAWLVDEPAGGQYAGRLLSTPTFFEDHGIEA
jgi:hypothetical protein